ncbi:MAG: hypothetical protein IOC90_06375 [Methylocystis sp.]|nr:hypothetical protein [Methylocystis sp.]MCA3583149.1 hypothetical protein [Methylocystis sp.]MCA3587646.1 hypothetical protein [Methylocystis sp.]MCA3590773.1 hypothetical protein [Methylocystis sp.]
MIDANANMEAVSPAGGRVAVGIAAVAFLGASAALWWRFGEGVYAQTLLNAVMACF